MLFSDITILDEQFRTKRHQYVLVEDGIIQSISEIPPQTNSGEI